MITLTTSDGFTFTVDETVASKMTTVTDLVADAGTENPIPLPNVDANALAYLLLFLNPSSEDTLGALFNVAKAATFLNAPTIVLCRKVMDAIPLVLLGSTQFKEDCISVRALLLPAMAIMTPDQLNLLKGKYVRAFDQTKDENQSLVAEIDMLLKNRTKWAAKHIDLFDYFISRGYIASDMFLTACAHGYTESFKSLSTRINLAHCGQSALCAAAMNGHDEIVTLLLKCKKLDLDKDNNAIVQASRHGRVGTLRLLLTRLTLHPSHETTQDAIWAAAHNGRQEVLAILLDTAGIVDPLQWAREYDLPRLVSHFSKKQKKL